MSIMSIILGMIIGILTSSYTLTIKMKDIIMKRNKRTIFLSLGIIVSLTILTWFLYNRYGFTNHFLAMELTTWVLVTLSIKDMKYKEVPLDVVILAGLLGTALLYFNPNVLWMDSLIGLIGIGGGLAFVSYITKGSLGMGDALVIGIIGLILGYKMALAVLLYALVLCGISGLVLMVFGKVSRKTKLPMIPFMLSVFLIIII